MKDVLLELDDLLKLHLQKDLEFSINNKVLKTGKFYLFEHGYFNFVFYIRTKTKNATLKIPIPFDFVQKPDRIELDYRISTFTNGIQPIVDVVERMKFKNPSKYYNNILTIRILT